MLTPGQKSYLDSLPDDKMVVVKPFDPRGLTVAKQIIDQLRSIVDDLSIELVGSLPLKIAGQQDVDIRICCEPIRQKTFISRITTLFGIPSRISTNTTSWDFTHEGYDVGIRLTGGKTITAQAQREVQSILEAHEKLRKEYEQIKLSASKLTYKQYQIRKYEFYNRILGLR